MKKTLRLFYLVLFYCLTIMYGYSQATITPVAGTYTCTGSGTVKLRVTKGKFSYEWTNASAPTTVIGTDSTIIVGPGTYNARYKETALSTTWVTATAYTVAQIVPSAITASAASSTSGIFCGTSGVTLNASTAANYTWKRSSSPTPVTVGSASALTVTGNSIVTGGTYSFTVTTTNPTSSCSATSNAISLTLYPSAPAKPTISADGVTTFCSGNTVGLSSSYTAGSNVWTRSVGADTTTTGTNKITIRVTNTVSVVAKDANGCVSPSSDPVTVTVNPVPTAPVITPSGSLSICAGDSLLISSDNKGTGSYTWSNSQTTRTIYAKTAGSYSVRFTNSFGCISPVSNTFVLSINALPAKPTITADAALTFCEGFTVGLSSSYSAFRNVWTRNVGGAISDTVTNTSSKLTVRNSAVITVRALDANGCYSLPATSVTTKMNARPVTPVVSVVTYPSNPIQQSGFNIGLCTGDSVQFALQNTGSYTKGSYLWSNTKTTKNITATSSGSYYLVYTDTLGCRSVESTAFIVTINSRPSQPVISYTSPLEFCDGGKVILTSSTSFQYLWNTGENTAAITVTKSGSFNVIAINDKGCRSVLASSNISVIVNPLPPKPTIAASGSLTFCPDKSVTLTSSSSETIYIWSEKLSERTNFSNTQSILVNKSGKYTVQTQSLKGCVSKSSDTTLVTVLEAPQAPTIYALSPTVFCDGKDVTLVALFANNNIANFSWRDEDTGLEYATTSSILIKRTGKFSVKVQDSRTCNSPYSSIQIVTVNPLPTKPVIQAVNGKIICDGDSALLRSSLPNTLPNNTASYKWTFNGTLLTVATRDLYAKGAGGYAVQVTDANGCQSVAYSDTAKITVNPLPTVPIITAVGLNPFCADKSLTLNSSADVGYKWSNGASTRSITINQAGLYSVQTINGFKCLSKPSNLIEAKVNALPASTNIFAGGNTIFCSGDSVQISTVSNYKAYWWVGADSLGYGANNVWYAKRGGNYTVRVQDFNGCFSPASTQRFIDVRATPVTPIVTQVGSYTIESTGDGDSNGYEWLLNGKTITGNAKNIKVRMDGNYQVRSSFTYTPIALPDNKLVCFSKVSAVKAFKADPNLDGLSIYPNPSTTGIFTVEVADDLVGAQVSVYDLVGRLLSFYVVEKFDSRKQIDLSNVPFNSFIVRVKLDGYEKTKHVSVIR
ncbi:T9SS type A sorting domain-containing protein [Flectobacillus roseus]|uniref:T9SS type A sorting domain-containing protein n=1 Tax=Flectobacillus roseus TaxID=502259 RepID=UPI0024B70563|nr:T9SS type A sorting domain-containing protein [Flectobacillus roseus]MDI9869210.1 T9SS type A sorting domain-containing protein [Flectobacillus roseus]